LNLSNKIFELIENNDGLAAEKTRMIFENGTSPYRAIYAGENVEYGNVIVTTNNNTMNMLYQALTRDGVLVAGKAQVSMSAINPASLEMTLHWQWLTGDFSSGISRWKEVNA
jgi:hypothetical protein